MNRNSSETSFAILHERLAAIVTQASSKRVDFVGICCKETAEMFGDVCRSSATIAAEVCLPAPSCPLSPASRHFPGHHALRVRPEAHYCTAKPHRHP